ncbi:hypothetical protein KL86DPRO_60097 [uncultured delta proteobacterium]|uniref:Uncharacterized protein n=1 Tax=uncultured delta proteobacterium TaxID=34034 RepID=A0A212KFF6_9DELT|nr:hypothetical protein KL86DPRO_60097 [uncultured delta proteobacterium]
MPSTLRVYQFHHQRVSEWYKVSLEVLQLKNKKKLQAVQSIA